MRRALRPLVLVVLVVAVGGCGGDDDVTTGAGAAAGASDPGGPGVDADPGPPGPCVAEETPRPPGMPVPPGRPVEIDVVTDAERDEAVAILRADPEIAAALDVGRLVWPTHWYVEDDVARGALLFYEFDEPVRLPSDLGVPAYTGEGDSSWPIYDEEGLPVLEPVEDLAAHERARSARIAVDLVEDRLYYIVAGPENALC